LLTFDAGSGVYYLEEIFIAGKSEVGIFLKFLGASLR
jgi:hypothetical protein